MKLLQRTADPRILSGREPAHPRRLLVISQRLPITLARSARNGWRAERAPGVLARALAPVLERRGGVWFGWPGVAAERTPALCRVLAGAIPGGGYTLRPVWLSGAELQSGCVEFASRVLWPLFHDIAPEHGFAPEHWRGYLRVNRKFARAVHRLAGGNDLVWVNDHHLMGVAAELRRLDRAASSGAARTAFFLHIPFPAPDLFLRLPWRSQLLSRLLAFDRLGFQTPRDLANFLSSVQLLLPGTEAVAGEGGVWQLLGVGDEGPFAAEAGAFPVGIDFDDVAARAAAPAVAARAAALRAELGGSPVLFGIDRLDPARGIPLKLRAFAEVLARSPALHRKAVLVQVVVPDRAEAPIHAGLQREIEGLVGEINGRYGRPGWIPVRYFHRTLPADELLAWYRAADLALLTPLREGMNLVAKEICAADLAEQSAVVLSEFAGAAVQLAPPHGGALLVNPHDVRATAAAVLRGLRLRPEERGARMRRMRRLVRGQDVAWWLDTFLGDEAGDRRCENVRQWR